MKIVKHTILILFIYLTACSISNGQSSQTVFNSSFQNLQKRADRFYDKHYYKEALDLYVRSLQKEEDNNYLKLKIANCYIQLREPNEAVVWYNKIPEQDTLFTDQQILQFAHSLAQTGDIENAEKWYKKYEEQNNSEDRIQSIIRYLDKPESLKQDTTRYDIEEVAISSPLPELAPTYYGNEGIVFVGAFRESSAIKYTSNISENTYFDLYVSTFSTDPSDVNKKILNEPVYFDKKLNSKLHEGPLAFAKQETKIIFTRNLNTSWPREKSSDGYTRLGLFEAQRDDRTSSKWYDVKEFPFNSREYSVCHPTLNRDGTVLYFASDMPGGAGGFDLYKSTFVDGYWTTPQNLGAKVNTAGNEVYPFFHNDETLYFASNGFGGFGGLDVYKINLTESGILTDRYHLVDPINTAADDFAFILDPVGTAGFFTSNRKGGLNDDLYKIYESEAYKTKEINYVVSGVITTENNGASSTGIMPLDSVQVRLVEVLTKDTLAVIYTSNEGKFEFNKANGDIKYPGQYKVLIQKENYGSNFFPFTVPEDESFELNVPIKINPLVDTTSVRTEENFEDDWDDDFEVPLLPSEPANNTIGTTEDTVKTNNTSTTLEEIEAVVAKPKRTSFELLGQVYEGLSSKKLKGARIYASSEDGKIINIEVDEKGDFDLNLKVDRTYIITARLNGYSSDCFKVEPVEPDAKYRQIEPFRVFPLFKNDTVITVNDLSYNIANWKLSNTVYSKFEETIKFLTDSPTYIIEVGVHSFKNDNSAINLYESRLKSLSIIEYLISQGISRNRLVAKGYGDSRPLLPCINNDCDESEKDKNNRVEVKVVNFTSNFVSEIRQFQEMRNGVQLTRINCTGDQKLSVDDNKTIFEGQIVDSNTQLALDSALIYVYNKETGNVKKIYSDSSGKIITHLNTKQEYIIKAFKENHKPACHIVKINDGVVRKVYDVTWSLEYFKNMSTDEQKASGYWGGNYNYTTCIEN